MIYRVEVTRRATRDLRQLYRSIHADASPAAKAWFDGLEIAVMSLAEHPARSPVTPENPALRQLLYRSRSYVYRVIYAVDDAALTVTVLHIRHGSREAM